MGGRGESEVLRFGISLNNDEKGVVSFMTDNINLLSIECMTLGKSSLIQGVIKYTVNITMLLCHHIYMYIYIYIYIVNRGNLGTGVVWVIGYVIH